MRTLQHSAATNASSASIEALQRNRIAARVGVSPSMAGVLAGLAWGADRRDHGVLLASLTAARVEAGCRQ